MRAALEILALLATVAGGTVSLYQLYKRWRRRPAPQPTAQAEFDAASERLQRERAEAAEALGRIREERG